MRMARVNIAVSDALLDQARGAGLNVSRLAAAALAEELDRRARITELDTLLDLLEDELGPIPQAEVDAAAAWADRTLPPAGRRPAAAARRTKA